MTTRNQQVARVDYETDREVSGAVEAEVIRQIDELAAGAHAILVSDYLKGVVSAAVASAAVQAGRRHDIPVLIDPKVPQYRLLRRRPDDRHAQPP